MPTLSISDASVTEGNAGSTNATYTVSLSAASSNTVLVDFFTAAGTATAGTDYTPVNGMLTFTPGQTAKTITVPVNGKVNARFEGVPLDAILDKLWVHGGARVDQEGGVTQGSVEFRRTYPKHRASRAAVPWTRRLAEP